MYPRSVVLRIIATFALIFMLCLVILIKASRNQIRDSEEKYRREVKKIHVLQKRINSYATQRHAYSSAIDILDIENQWYKEAYFKKCGELEEEKLLSVKATRAILEKQKAINKLQEELINNAKETQKNQQQSSTSRGEARDTQLLGDNYLGEFRATAYNGQEPGGGGSRTALGTMVGPGTIATDPKVILLGTKLYIAGYGEGVALDTGGAIKGKRIDLWFSSIEACNNYGIRMVKVWRRE